MDALAILGSIIAAIAVGAISPGPSFVLVSRIALTTSRAHGLASALGMGVGGLLFASLAVLGLTALLMQFEWLYFAFKIVGGCYLMYVAFRIYQNASNPLEAGNSVQGGAKELTLSRAFFAGLITQLSNPKTSIFYASIFAAVLPLEPARWLLFAIPAALFVVEAGWYSIVALAFSGFRMRALYGRLKKWLDYAAGTVMGLLGAKLIIEAFHRKM